MPDLPEQLITAAFVSTHGADEALIDVQQAELDGLVKIRGAGIIHCDLDGKLNVEHATPHGDGGRAIAGGFWDERLRQVSDTLQPGASALVVVLEQTWLSEMLQQIGETASELSTASV